MSFFQNIIDNIKYIFNKENKIKKYDKIYSEKLYILFGCLKDRICCYFDDTDKNLMINLNKNFWTLKYVFFDVYEYKKINKLHIRKFCSNYDMFMWAIHNGYKIKYKTTFFLNNIEVFKYCIEKGYPPNSITLENVVLYGNLENIKWLCNNGYQTTSRTFKNALINGNLENIKWLYKNNCRCYKNYDMSFINFDNKNVFECIDFLCSENFIITSQTLCNAIKSKKIENIEYVLSKNSKLIIDDEIVECIIMDSNIEIMELLLRNNCKHKKKNFYYAIRHCNLENIKWLYNNIFHNFNYDNDGEIICAAIYNGNLENIRWIYDNIKNINYCLDPYIEIINKNNLNIIDDIKLFEFFLEKGHNLNVKVFVNIVKNMAINDKFEIEKLEWLKKNECPYNYEVYHNVVKYGASQILEWLIVNDYKMFDYVGRIRHITKNIHIYKVIIKYGFKFIDNDSKYDDYDERKYKIFMEKDKQEGAML